MKICFIYSIIRFALNFKFFFRESYIPLSPQQNAFQHSNMTPALSRLTPREYRSLTTNNRLTGRSVSSDSVYTILIRLPGESGDGSNCNDAPSIRMIPEVMFFHLCLLNNISIKHKEVVKSLIKHSLLTMPSHISYPFLSY